LDTLTAENANLKAEQTELYKSNASNAQRILNLLDVDQLQKAKIQNLEEKFPFLI
jgi:hypothetical protein